MKADAAAIPDHTVGPNATAALAVETAIQPGPRPGTIVYEMPFEAPCDGPGDCQVHWTGRATLSAIGPTLFRIVAHDIYDNRGGRGVEEHALIVDRTGLITQPDTPTPSSSQISYMTKLTALSIGKITSDTINRPTVTDAILSLTDGDTLASFRCSFKSSGVTVQQQCDLTDGIDRHYEHGHYIYAQATLPAADTLDYQWNPALNIYLFDNSAGSYHPLYRYWIPIYCLGDSCRGHSHKIVDYKLDGGDWHSKTVSAALSPADREKANALFAAGFDDYKANNFASAAALFLRGLAIDPANYKATYALAEVARSNRIGGNGGTWYIYFALHYYQRTLDLAPPDAVEAIRSQAHIEAGSIQ